MQKIKLLMLTIVLFNTTSCTMIFQAYIRNTTNKPATIDVFILDKKHMETLPNQVKVANQIVEFKLGYKKYFASIQNVEWIDISHFKVEIKPNTTIDLTDIAGRFMNAHSTTDTRVTVTIDNKVDTLIDGRHDSLSKFRYRNVGISTPILYFDVK